MGRVLEQVADGGLVVELLLQHLEDDAPFEREVCGLVVVGENASLDEALDPISAPEHLLHGLQRRKVSGIAGGGSRSPTAPTTLVERCQARATSSPKTFSVLGSGVRP